MDSLNYDDCVNLLKLLNMKNDVLAVARGCQKTVEAPGTANSLLCKPFCQCTESNCFHCRFDLSDLTCFQNLRRMVEDQVQSGQSGWRVTHRTKLCNTATQGKLIHLSLATRPLGLVLSLLGLTRIFTFDCFHH